MMEGTYQQQPSVGYESGLAVMLMLAPASQTPRPRGLRGAPGCDAHARAGPHDRHGLLPERVERESRESRERVETESRQSRDRIESRERVESLEEDASRPR